MSTKAVHLEPVFKLDTASFLAAFRRFVARRGMIRTLVSDNGSNFVGADKELQSMLQQVFDSAASEEIAAELAKQRVKWTFIPPRAPNQGGLWEGAVKAFKKYLKLVCVSGLNFEQFNTLVSQIEGILNSRPIVPISSDPNDFCVLTPTHFLIGGSINAVPEASLLELEVQRLDKWQLIQRIKELFWRRWKEEYLQELERRAKWFKKSRPLKVGELVILKDDETFPLGWTMDRVEGVFSAADGQVRSALIRTSQGVIKRP